MTANLGSDGPASPAGPDGAAGSGGAEGIPYETRHPNAYMWTEIAYDYLLAGKLTASVAIKGGISTATVTGPCPSCADNVNFSQVLDVVTGESLGPLGLRDRSPVPSDYVPLTVSCCCTARHAGRPDGIGHGCGINFRVDVLRNT